MWRLWIPISTRTPTSFRAWAMPATGCSAPNRMARFAGQLLLALALAGLLAGCQQTGSAAPQSAAKSRNDGRLRFFEPEFATLLNQVVDHLGEACSPSATDEARLNACLRDH